jgi:hypothetical protein
MGKTSVFRQLKWNGNFKPCDFDPKGFKPTTNDEALACQNLFRVMRDMGYTDIFCFAGNVPEPEDADDEFEYVFVVPTMDMYRELIRRSLYRDGRGDAISPFTMEYIEHFREWRGKLYRKAYDYHCALGPGRVKVIEVADSDWYLSELFKEVL